MLKRAREVEREAGREGKNGWMTDRARERCWSYFPVFDQKPLLDHDSKISDVHGVF